MCVHVHTMCVRSSIELIFDSSFDLLSRVCHESVFTQLFLSLSLSDIFYISYLIYLRVRDPIPKMFVSPRKNQRIYSFT